MNLSSKPQRRLLTVAAVLSAGVILTSAGCSSDRTAATAAGGATSASTPAAAATDHAAVAGTTGTTPAGQPSSAAPAAGAGGVTTASTAGHTAGPVAGRPAATTPGAPASSAGPLTEPKQPGPPPPPPVPASSLPNAAAADWQPVGDLTDMTLPAMGDIRIGECAGVHSAAAWHEQGYVSALHTPAQEDVFGFGDPVTATKAFEGIAAGLNSCAAASRALQQKSGVPVDATVVTTATANQAQAWSRQWTGVAGQSAAGPQTNHYYLVQRGDTVVLAAFTEFGAAPAHRYDTAGDPAVLTMLAAHAGS